MSKWEFDLVGTFESERDAEDYAKRNGVDLRDIRTRATAAGVELEVRRDNVDEQDLRDAGERRRDGWV